MQTVSCRSHLGLALCLLLAGCASPREHAPALVTVPEDDVMMVEPVPQVVPRTGTPLIPAPTRPPLAHTNVFTETWVPLENWSKVEGFGAPLRMAGEAGAVYSVATSNGTMTIRVGSQFASWNGLQYMLGFAPKLIAGRPCVNNLDVRNNFEPLIKRAPGLAGSIRTLVIDPGHGGTDAGAQSIYNGHFEKEYTLDVARRLQAILITNGWNALLTRSNDTYLALSNRVAFAEHCRADFFLSVHFNSHAPDKEQAGLETYCLTPAGMPSNLVRGFVDNAGLSFPNNRYDSQNLQYAVLLHRAVLGVNGHLDRGVRRARFLGVLQTQNRPAVLVEGGYLSNPKEARQIADSAYRQKLAEAMAAALLEDSKPRLNLASQLPAAASPATEAKAN